MDDQTNNPPQDDQQAGQQADELKEPTDEELRSAAEELDLEDPDDKKHQAAEPPSVVGEQDVFSGDMPETGEGYDIDAELGKVGLTGDDDGMKPLGVATELDDEVK